MWLWQGGSIYRQMLPILQTPQNAINTSLKAGTGHWECIPGANLSTSLDLSTDRAALGSMGESTQRSGPGRSAGRAQPQAPKTLGTRNPGHAQPWACTAPPDCANLLRGALGAAMQNCC